MVSITKTFLLLIVCIYIIILIALATAISIIVKLKAKTKSGYKDSDNTVVFKSNDLVYSDILSSNSDGKIKNLMLPNSSSEFTIGYFKFKYLAESAENNRFLVDIGGKRYWLGTAPKKQRKNVNKK